MKMQDLSRVMYEFQTSGSVFGLSFVVGFDTDQLQLDHLQHSAMVHTTSLIGKMVNLSLLCVFFVFGNFSKF